MLTFSISDYAPSPLEILVILDRLSCMEERINQLNLPLRLDSPARTVLDQIHLMLDQQEALRLV